MPSVYLANVAGDGLSSQTAFRPDITTSLGWAALMVDSANGKCVIVAGDDAIADVGVRQLLTAATLPALRTLALTTNPTPGQRSALATWLANNGYLPLTAAQVTWAQTIHFVARQVNGSADLALTGAA